jgi:Protein of unknown function (DUF1559)
MRSISRLFPIRPVWLAGLGGVVAAAFLLLAASSEPRAAADEAKAALPPYLERIPLDADLFGRLRVAEVYNGPQVQAARKALGKQADELEKNFEKEIGLALSNVETASFCFPRMPSGPGDDNVFLIVVSTIQPYDGAKLFAKLRKGEAKDKVNPLGDNMVLHQTSEKLFAVMHKSLLDAYTKGPALGKEGVLAGTIRLAAGKDMFVGGINLDSLPGEIRTNLPVEAQPFKPLIDAQALSAVAEIGKDLKGELRFQCKKADDAQDAERSWKLLMKLAEFGLTEVQKEENVKREQEIVAFLPFLKELQNTVKNTTTKIDGSTFQVSATLKGDLPVAPIAMQLFGKVNKASARAVSQNNLKQIALAMHNYHDSFNGFPPAAICDKKGKPMLSWRVAILPFVEQDQLYKEFHLDEPWDSDHNKKLLAKMPRIYAMPDTAKQGETKTHYRVFYGNGAGFELLLPTGIRDITDGTSNTCMVVEAAEGVEWSKPDELEYDPKKDPRKVVRWVNDVCQAALFDGSVRAISKKTSEQTWHNFIQKADGNVLGDDF